MSFISSSVISLGFEWCTFGKIQVSYGYLENSGQNVKVCSVSATINSVFIFFIKDENKPRYQNMVWYLEACGLDFETVVKKINSTKRQQEQSRLCT